MCDQTNTPTLTMPRTADGRLICYRENCRYQTGDYYCSCSNVFIDEARMCGNYKPVTTCGKCRHYHKMECLFYPSHINEDEDICDTFEPMITLCPRKD